MAPFYFYFNLKYSHRRPTGHVILLAKGKLSVVLAKIIIHNYFKDNENTQAGDNYGCTR